MNSNDCFNNIIINYYCICLLFDFTITIIAIFILNLRAGQVILYMFILNIESNFVYEAFSNLLFYQKNLI
jgi:hypothetical protein